MDPIEGVDNEDTTAKIMDEDKHIFIHDGRRVVVVKCQLCGLFTERHYFIRSSICPVCPVCVEGLV